MIVELNEVFNIIDVEVSDIDKNITKSVGRLIVFRLCSKYGEKLNVQIRGTFDLFYDRIIDSKYLKDSLTSTSLDITLKQFLCNFGIYFTEDTDSGIDLNRSGSHRLLILDEWIGLDEFIKIRESSNNTITDLFIKSMHENCEYDDLYETLNNSRYSSPDIWYEQNNYNLYSSQSARDRAYEAKYDSSSIKDITYELSEILNFITVKSSVFSDLLEYGAELYDSGIECVKFRGNAVNIGHSDIYVAFLVYLAEEYGISVNTDIDADFCNAYEEYRRGSYCLAEDLFSVINDIEPVMYFVKKSNKRLVFIRDLICSYHYEYVTNKELELLCIGDKSIKMSRWDSPTKSDFKDQWSVSKNDIEKSAFVKKYINNEFNSDYEIIPVFDVINSDEYMSEVIKAFNIHNAFILDSKDKARKCITVRDLLCRKVKNGNSDEIQIGFISSPDIDDFNYRIRLKAIVSEVNENDPNIIHRSYFSFNNDNISRLFNTDYIFDLFDKAPMSIINLIRNTCHVGDEDFDNDNDIDLDCYCSVPEKFLYYKLTSILQQLGKNENIIVIPDGKKELKASRFSSVYTASEIVPELSQRFGIENVIESGVIDMYGNITDKFITANSTKKFFNIRNELFSVMK